jgi:hypothetical protein
MEIPIKNDQDDQNMDGHSGSYVKAVKGNDRNSIVGKITYIPPTVLDNGEKVIMIKKEYIEDVQDHYKLHL